MELQRQPNGWSCLPTAFAMALDIPVEKLLRELGHDGSLVVFPEFRDPYCRRGFHPQELVELCYRRHKHVIEFQACPTLVPPTIAGVRCRPEMAIYTQEETQSRMDFLLKRKGVLTGDTRLGKPNHAVAWNGEIIYDPNGSTYPLTDFIIGSFWLVT